MDRLNKSYLTADTYPENLIASLRFEYQLREYRQKLEHDANRLFCNERNAKIIVLQLDEGKDGMKVRRSKVKLTTDLPHCLDFQRQYEVCTLNMMQDLLGMKNRHGCRDPICRFL